MDFAREFGLSPNIVEKDYVIGWLLAGIGNHAELSPFWVFKGGTCLKKCYFETYRFSEDLDFTLKDPGQLNEEFLLHTFRQISDWVYEASGIEIPQETIRFDIYSNPRGNPSAQGRVGYRGPMGRGGDAPRVKLDLTGDEILVMDAVFRDVHHPYSDRPGNGIQILCYCFEELFAEKIRALAERERPRDLYDVVHFYRHEELKADRGAIFDALEKKCAFKGILSPLWRLWRRNPVVKSLNPNGGTCSVISCRPCLPLNNSGKTFPMFLVGYIAVLKRLRNPRFRLHLSRLTRLGIRLRWLPLGTRQFPWKVFDSQQQTACVWSWLIKGVPD